MCAAIGRATSVGLSVLIGIEQEAAVKLAGGKLTTGVAVHASVHSSRASRDPLATTEPAVPARRFGSTSNFAPTVARGPLDVVR